MKTDYCTYPPQIAADVEITPQRDGDRQSFIIGSLAVSRFILLRETEHQVLRLLDAAHIPEAICAAFKQKHGATLAPATLTRFLTKLDEVGILAGERSHREMPDDPQASTQFYYRLRLFNPERLFARLVTPLRWMWTPTFAWGSLGVMLLVAALALLNGPEVWSYGLATVRDYSVAILVASLVIAITHELAHGLTCKAFGGRVTEIGVLLIFYVLPGLYCNVSGLHLIPERNRRLWVILAGVYWQMMVGTLALLAWFLFAPYTLLADLAFIIFLGGVLDVIFNANPLLKLDGYYFLSQWLRLPNLLDRSRAYWRDWLKWLFWGEPQAALNKWSRRERAIFGVYGLVSFVYTVVLRIIVIIFAGAWLADRFHFIGLLGAAGLALFYSRNLLRSVGSAVGQRLRTAQQQPAEAGARNLENAMETNQTTRTGATWRRRLIAVAILLLIVTVLCLPWQASVGNYGTLVAIPGQEAIIRAPENATLMELRVQPGSLVAGGAVIGRLGNLELEEQIAAVNTELARVNADYERLQGELRAQTEVTTRANLQWQRRQHEFTEVQTEQQQIHERRRTEERNEAVRLVTISHAEPQTGPRAVATYPAALAVLQSEAETRQAHLYEARRQLDRARQLFAQGITPRSELDTIETRVATLGNELAGAGQRLEAALVEHQRKFTGLTTEMNLARSDLNATALQTAKLNDEVQAARALIGTLEARRDLLRRKQAQFELLTPRAGAVFGEDLSRQLGQYFQKGAEICRIADTRQLLLRIQVPEREIGDVRVGHPVRLRSRAFPEPVFTGVVSKIGGESERDENNQTTYRVELTIENVDGQLRPGMTAFARIEFGRQMIGGILLHKARQVLRPELWML